MMSKERPEDKYEYEYVGEEGMIVYPASSTVGKPPDPKALELFRATMRKEILERRRRGAG
jgi:hypothetical protein